MKKTLFCILTFLFIFIGMNAQNRLGLYGNKKPTMKSIVLTAIGPAFLFGDVGGSLQEQALFGANDLVLKETRYLFSLGYRHTYPNNIGYKATAYVGKFAGSDVGSRFDGKRFYSFSTDIVELSVQGEFILMGGPFSVYRTPHTMYLYAGAGVLGSRANLLWKNLPISSTNQTGRSDTYDPTTIAPVFPFGMGYMYRFNDRFSLGAEFGWHYILSDYIDGVQMKTSKNNDALANITFTFIYRIAGGLINDYDCHCDR